MKCKILIDDKIGRFKRGEIGEVLENDFEKYDYCVNLPGVQSIPAFLGGGLGKRIYYFYKNEVELLEVKYEK